MPATDLAALLTRQPYVRIGHVVENGLAQRATTSRWLHELADAGLLSRQTIGSMGHSWSSRSTSTSGLWAVTAILRDRSRSSSEPNCMASPLTVA